MKPGRTIKIVLAFLFAAIVFVTSNCGKKVQNVNKNFIGNWKYTFSGAMRTENITITDDRQSEVNTCEVNSAGTYCPYGTCYECVSNGSGRARIKDNILHIGTARYKINQAPTKGSGGIYYMILNGKTFVKVNSDESCYDGIWNQDETAVDCGGICPKCPTCYDGIKNQGETSIDCGGSACASCFNSFTYTVTDPVTNMSHTYTASTVVASRHNNDFILEIDFESGSQKLYLEFYGNGTGTYNFYNVSYVTPGAGLDDYYIDWTTANITMTTMNSGTKRMSGTFSFEAYNNNAAPPTSTTCTVSSGSFSNLSYYTN